MNKGYCSAVVKGVRICPCMPWSIIRNYNFHKREKNIIDGLEFFELNKRYDMLEIKFSFLEYTLADGTGKKKNDI